MIGEAHGHVENCVVSHGKEGTCPRALFLSVLPQRASLSQGLSSLSPRGYSPFWSLS